MGDPANFDGKRGSRKGKKYPPEPLNPVEVAALLKTFTPSKSGKRSKALAILLWRVGTRISETLALKVKDVDLAAGTVTVLNGKGDKRRVIGLDIMALQAMELWIPIALTYSTGEKWLFPKITKGTQGKPITGNYARKMLREKREKAGIDKPVRPHGMRHTLVHELAEDKNVSIHSIKDILGQESLAATEHYVTKLNPTTALDALRNRSCE